MHLKLDWCDYKTAKWAVENWHYSKTMPSGKLVKIGVWENNKYIGAIIYGLGANASIANYNNLKTAELQRVALTTHETPVTKIISISIKMLKKLCPKLEQLISYADLDQGHQGGIYKGGNWKLEEITIAKWIRLNGKMQHPRSINAKYGTCAIGWLRANIDSNAEHVDTKGKIRFTYDLRHRSKSKTARYHLAEAGAVPSMTHQNTEGTPNYG
jgi:hypothetical protein